MIQVSGVFAGGAKVEQANATASDVLSGKTFFSGNKTLKTGTMPSRGAATITPATYDQTIAAGQYLSGVQTLKGDGYLQAPYIRSGYGIFGVAGNCESIVDKFAAAPAVAGETVRYSEDGLITEGSRSYVNRRWMSVNKSGVMRVKYNLYSAANYSVRARLYSSRLGVISGSEIYTYYSNGTKNMVIDISIAAGDTIYLQLMADDIYAANNTYFYFCVGQPDFGAGYIPALVP